MKEKENTDKNVLISTIFLEESQRASCEVSCPPAPHTPNALMCRVAGQN